MLIDFKIGNFKSFKEAIDLSLIKGKTRINNERVEHFKNLDVLKFSAVFGANASGKSNLTSALRIMKFLVLNNGIPADALNEYYRLDDSFINKPTYFEVIISIANKFYSYGFEVSLTSNVYSSEWLVELIVNRDGKIRERTLFERNNNKISLDIFKTKSAAITNKIEVYKDNVEATPTVLFLNYINSVNNVLFDYKDLDILALKNVFNWFKTSLNIIDPRVPFTHPDYITIDSKLKQLKSLLKAFDTGIKDIKEERSSEEEFRRSNFYNINVDSIKNLLAQQRHSQTFAKAITPLSFMLRNNVDFWTITLDEKGNFNYFKLVFLHDDNEKHVFSLKDESDGTLRIFDLAEVLLSQTCDKVFVIDELDRCLHPSLTLQFVKLFLNQCSNNGFTNQLIVTTHESRLLDLSILRRDEIWFMKKENGVSSLYSLENYNERFDKVIDKAYLEGRYGGVPIFDSVFLPEYTCHENKAK